MSGRQAKRKRRLRAEAGLPPRERSQGHNVLDLEDTREQRRAKTFKKRMIAAELRETDPIAHRKKVGFWDHVRVWLTLPTYRDALGDPHRGAHERIKKSD